MGDPTELPGATTQLPGATTEPSGWGARTTFLLPHQPENVPAVLWTPTGVERPPVVLLGHGGDNHRLTPRHAFFAEWFARHAGAACLALDAPWHGDRAIPGESGTDYHSRMIAADPERVQRQVVGEWLAALDTLAAAGLVDADRLAWIGFSLGGIFGFPVCAALGPRLRSAVLGKVGTTCAPHLHDIASPELMAASAARITAPVLFQVQWDDEIFPRRLQLDLFDLVAAPRKLLRAHPGRHGDTWPDDEAAWRGFVRDHLA